MAEWQVIAAPLDCAAQAEGEERAPGALLAAGFGDLSALSPVHIDTRLDHPERDSHSGVIAIADLRRATAEVELAVAQIIARGDRPLLLGGDCAVLPGALAAARTAVPELRLLYLDGHPDACDGKTSPTGEAADMTLVAMTTDRIPELLPVEQQPPIVAPDRVALLGYRGGAPADVELADGTNVSEASLLPEGLVRIDAAALMELSPERGAAEALQAIGTRPGSLWLQIDVDVVDEVEMPAVSYPQPDGLSVSHLTALLREVLARTEPVGVSITCFNPDLDPDGDVAREVLPSIVAAIAD